MRHRRATEADLDVVVETLVTSHLDYVWEAWALQGPDRKEQLTKLVRTDIELIVLPYREVWMSEDGSAVAVWQREPSEPVPDDVLARMEAVLQSVYGRRLALIREVDMVLHPLRPQEPHWFLGSVGVRPESQRQGRGTALLRCVLDELDRTGQAACLETSSLDNVDFYTRLGFMVIAYLDDLPGGAPELWLMWRPAGSSAGAGV